MIHQLIFPCFIKNTPRVLLIFVSILLASIAAIAQPGDATDSLITIKQEFKKNEIIQFTVKLDNKNNPKKKANVRSVKTISCACGDKEFHYRLYSIADTKYPSNRKGFFFREEKPDAKQCCCKFSPAKLYNNKKYSIPPINKNGNYILIIKGTGFTMYSNVFVVTD